MIVPGLGISTGKPSTYEELERRLLLLGIAPTGNFQIDLAKLRSAINKRVEEFKVEKREERKEEENKILEKIEEEKSGATQRALQNKIFHKI